MAGTRLKDIDLTLALCRDDTDWEMTDKEKAAFNVNNLVLCVSASQLTKVLNILRQLSRRTLDPTPSSPYGTAVELSL